MPTLWKDRPDASTPLSAAELEAFRDELEAHAASVAAGGILLGSEKIEANNTQTGAGSKYVTGLDVTVDDPGDRPLVIRLTAVFYNSSASGIATCSIEEGATLLQSMTRALTTVTFDGTKETAPLPAAGSASSRTFRVKIAQLITGNTVMAGAAGAPSSISVLQV